MKQLIFILNMNLFFLFGLSCLEEAPLLRFVYHSKMGSKFSLHSDVMQELKKLFGVVTFIETGTYLGATTLAAASCFDFVYTIELSSDFYKQNKQLFRDVDNIYAFHGDSGAILSEIIPNILGVKLFFLDGHYMGGYSALGSKVTPIFEELDALQRVDDIKNCVLLIDDIRLFRTKVRERQFFGDKDYPLLEEVVQRIKEINSDYRFALLGDALLVFDGSNNIELSEVLNACTQHRLSFSMEPSHWLKDIEQKIAHASQDELFWLKYTADYIPPGAYGAGAHYQFWYGLVLLERGHYPEALEYFFRAIEYGYIHPHVFEYIERARNIMESF